MDSVLFEVQGHIGIISLNRPPVNAVDSAMKKALTNLLSGINQDENIHCVVIRAIGKGFCAGNDLKDLKQLDDTTLGAEYADLLHAIQECRKPIIAAIHGFVAGLGIAIVSLCDIIVASENSWFSLPEINAGTIPSPFFLQKLLPDKLARYYMFTGNPVAVQDVAQYGSILRIVPQEELHATVLEIAEEISCKPPKLIGLCKQILLDEEKSPTDIVTASIRARSAASQLKNSGD